MVCWVGWAWCWCTWRLPLCSCHACGVVTNDRSRLHAAAGLSICVAFAVFGVTEMMLRDMRTASFYAAWVALLLALSEPRSGTQDAASTAS